MRTGIIPIRIFLASPTDVSAERSVARKVIDTLQHDPTFGERIKFEAIGWDTPGAETPLTATLSPPEAIAKSLPKPSECDIVLVIFWSRMGTIVSSTRLKPDGNRYLSGTELEYWDAFVAAEKSGKPTILVYRCNKDINLNPKDADFQAKLEQWRQVEIFFNNFRNPDGSSDHSYNSYVTPDDFREKLEYHIRVLVHQIIDDKNTEPLSNPDSNLSPLWTGSPFPGLRAFSPNDEPIFFGRGREIDSILKLVSEQRFVAVIGASGSGKSSIVGAGIIPRLKSNSIEGSKDWLLPDFIPHLNQWTGLHFTPGETGENPFLALAIKLAPIAKTTPRELADILAKSPIDFTLFAERAFAEKTTWSELLLFVDQFEELFTLVTPTYIEPFIMLLSHISKLPRIRTIVTMRSDYYHRCIEIPALAILMENGSFPLSLPSAISLHDMMSRPAERAGFRFEDGLTEQIISDTGQDSGALALMAYALDELYHISREREDRLITFEDYNILGKVQGAIGERAEAIFSVLQLRNSELTMRNVFRELVDVNEYGEPSRKRADYLRLSSGIDSKKLVDAFVDARLFVTSGSETDAIVEVSHEALLRNWRRLAEWIKIFANDLRLLTQVSRAASEWELRGRPQSYLWRHERLLEVYEMQKRLAPNLDNLARDFLIPEPELLLLRHEYSNSMEEYDIERRLVEIGDYAIPFLAKRLHAQDSRIRRSVVRVLSRSRSNEIVPMLIEAMQDSDGYVRRSAIEGIRTCIYYKQGDRYSILETLVRAVYDNSKLVRRYALEQLTAAHAQVPREAIIKCLGSDYPEEVIEAIIYCGNMDEYDDELMSYVDVAIYNVPVKKLWWITHQLQKVDTPTALEIGSEIEFREESEEP